MNCIINIQKVLIYTLIYDVFVYFKYLKFIHNLVAAVEITTHMVGYTFVSCYGFLAFVIVNSNAYKGIYTYIPYII